MLNFIRKHDLWEACDKGYLKQLDCQKLSYQLKHAQDLIIYSYLNDKCGLRVAEIGGGDSRILKQLAINNSCFNVEKFEGRDGGPKTEVQIAGVTNIPAYIGDYDPLIQDSSFDVVFSISVVEHVATDSLANFHRDVLRILKPNGIFLHAIDMYLEGQSTPYTRERFESYRQWVSGALGSVAIGKLYDGPLSFSPDMASNPDNILYGWNKLVPSLSQLRAKAQNVSLLVGGRKL